MPQGEISSISADIIPAFSTEDRLHPANRLAFLSQANSAQEQLNNFNPARWDFAGEYRPDPLSQATQDNNFNDLNPSPRGLAQEDLADPPGPLTSQEEDLILLEEIQAVRHEVMESCGEEYENDDRASEQKTENMMDCLLDRASARLAGKIREYHRELKIQIEGTDDQWRLETEFDAVVPLYGTGHQALFLQPGFILSIKDSSAPENVIAGSLGLIYRFTFHRGVLGFNIFYDRQKTLDSDSVLQERLGLGADWQNNRNIFSFNYYYPLEGWKSLGEFYEERALEGADFRFRRLFSERIEGEGGFSYWDSKTGQDRRIASIGFDYKLGCSSSLNVESNRDFETDNTSLFLRYKVRLGEPLTGANCLQRQYERDRGDRLYEPVEREKRIRLERRRRAISLTIPDQRATVGEAFSYTVSESAFRSVRADESPDILILSLPDWLEYDKSSMRFYGTALKTGTYQATGLVSLPRLDQKSSWSFNIVVAQTAKSAPALQAETQNITKGETKFFKPLIQNVDGDFFVDIHPVSGFSPLALWHEGRLEFEIDARQAHLGSYHITGLIRDEKGRASAWSFKVIVAPRDLQDVISAQNQPSIPQLRAPDQILYQGESLSFSPVIDSLRQAESFTVRAHAPAGEGAPTVAWDQNSHQFFISALQAEKGVYTITGLIYSNETELFSNWSFKVAVIERPEVAPTDSASRRQASGPILDDQAPTLTAQNQTVPLGQSLNYSPEIGNLRLGESYSVSVSALPTGAPAVVWSESHSRFAINAASASLGAYTITGSIEDENGNSSNWSFIIQVILDGEPRERRLSMDDPVQEGPRLTAAHQFLQQGESLNYAPQIQGLSPGESYSVSVSALPTGAPAVVWSESHSRFAINAASASLGTYTITGSIEDENGHSNNWSFKVTVTMRAIIINPPPSPRSRSGSSPVVDNQAPILTAQDQTITIGQSLNYAPAIGQLRPGEGYTVAVNNVPLGAPAVVWSESHSQFSINAESATQGQYSISGTITDDNNNSNSWSFNITVNPAVVSPPADPVAPPVEPTPTDTTAPTLTAQDQTITIGQSLNYAPAIGQLRPGEGYTVAVNNVPLGAPAVVWSESDSQFSINAESASQGQYSISGTITDDNSNSNSWSFNITVNPAVVSPPADPVAPPVEPTPTDTTAPTLTAQDQSITIGQSLNYAPAIGQLRQGEGYTVAVSNVPTGAPAVIWSASDSQFSINAESASQGQYSISGTITDDNNNSNNWSFNITVNPADTTAPLLSIGNISVEIGTVFSHSPTITQLRQNEGYTVSVTNVPSGAPNVTWDTSNAQFSIDSTNALTIQQGQHTIKGSIQDENGNSSNWSFKITVLIMPV